MSATTTRRLAFATSAELASIQLDDAHLAHALEQRGITPASCVWNDPAVDWAAFDAVLIRTIWDYYKHHDAFIGWLDQLDQLGIPTLNESRVLRWNSDKSYLLDLDEQGVAIIPTALATADELAALLASLPDQQLVIKPTISGGAWHTVRGRVGDAAFAAAVTQLPRNIDYLVQPFVPEIVSAGEWSLLYFGGKFSHAVVKRPATGDYRVQSEYGGSIEPAQPAAATLAAAGKALAAVAALGYGELVYARVDGVVSADQFLIMELELIEPFLFLAEQPRSAEQFAQQVAQRVFIGAHG